MYKISGNQAMPARQRAGWLSSMILLASFGAQAAAPPVITITGTVGNSTQNLDGYAGTVAFDFSTWLGKPYTLELRPDAASVAKVVEPIDDIPGSFLNSWSPANVGYSLSIDGSLVYSGQDNQFSELASANNILIPAGLTDLPAGVVADGTHTYDFLSIAASGISAGCFDGGANGICDDPNDIHQYGKIWFEYVWDTAIRQGIANEAYPDLRNTSFTDGVGSAYFTVGHFVPALADGVGRVQLTFSVDSVSVTPVPEPATWTMLLAGLGLAAATAARRRSSRFDL